MNITRILVSIALAATVAACGSAATPKPAPVETTLEANEFAFTPKEIKAVVGSTVKITVTNKGTLEHDFTIESLNVKVAAAVGKTVSGTTGVLAAGTYDFFCSVAGHKEAGMAGKLVVE